MLLYVLRRLLWTALTVLGVMIITFLLFRVTAGDIAGAHLGEKATNRQRAEWLHKHHYDLPWIINVHRQVLLVDQTGGAGSLKVQRRSDTLAGQLGLVLATEGDNAPPGSLLGRHVAWLNDGTDRDRLIEGKAFVHAEDANRPILALELADGSELAVDLSGVGDAGQLLATINADPDNAGRLTARYTDWSLATLLSSQFFRHLYTSVTFDAESLVSGQPLTHILAEHALESLAIPVPSLPLGWALAMVISSYVAYYHGRLADHLVVFLCVLGLCIPFLAYMIFGQALMFWLSPPHAYGTFHRVNLYVPIGIMVIAGLGGSVRFYRTVILDEANRDYVRTARAKGVPLPTVMFKHVLKNCMLPILTNLVAAIPFLIMGNLLVERYFGIPGLGDLMLTSINNRDEPILSGMVFLTALVYSLGILLTDLSYAVFDPRVRLR